MANLFADFRQPIFRLLEREGKFRVSDARVRAGALSLVHERKSTVMRTFADLLQSVAFALCNAGHVFFLSVCHGLFLAECSRAALFDSPLYSKTSRFQFPVCGFDRAQRSALLDVYRAETSVGLERKPRGHGAECIAFDDTGFGKRFSQRRDEHRYAR